MRILKKVLIISAIAIITIVTLRDNNYIAATISTQLSPRTPVRIGLFSRDLNDDYIVSLCKNFEDIQKNNEGKVAFSFYNANFNQATQNSDIDSKLREGIDLVLLDIVDVNEVNELINKIAQYNVPVIVFNKEPFTLDAIKSYKKALYVGSDSKQAGIKTEELTSNMLHWSTESARSTVEALFLRYGDKIEVIISNDDSMAIGAIQALQKYGYNNGNKSKLIPVVGVDATPEAKELISKGFMLGSAEQDPLDIANAIYTIGINLVNDRNPVEGTPYKLDETGATVHLPHKEYTGPMFN